MAGELEQPDDSMEDYVCVSLRISTLHTPEQHAQVRGGISLPPSLVQKPDSRPIVYPTTSS